MKNLAAFTAMAGLGNLGVTIWHLCLVSELNTALSFAEVARIGAVGNTFYGVFTGNGVPFGRPFANVDPIFFKMRVSD